jgi:hypothetical protein
LIFGIKSASVSIRKEGSAKKMGQIIAKKGKLKDCPN